jgi:hypothetical protein
MPRACNHWTAPLNLNPRRLVLAGWRTANIMQPDPRDERQKAIDAVLNNLEKFRQSLLSFVDAQIPDIQRPPEKPDDWQSEFEPEKLKQNFSGLAARMLKIGWVTDADVTDEHSLLSKLTEAGKLRFRQAAETHLNALPHVFYSKGHIRPLPENTILPKRDQTLIVLDLVALCVQLGPSKLSLGEMTILRGFVAWYAQILADENPT